VSGEPHRGQTEVGRALTGIPQDGQNAEPGGRRAPHLGQVVDAIALRLRFHLIYFVVPRGSRAIAVRRAGPRLRDRGARPGTRRPGSVVSFFCPSVIPGLMADPDECELHEVVLSAEADEAKELIRVAQSPIGDECQYCPVCRSAREFVERRLAEESGYVPPAGESADASWKKLQRAIENARVAIHRAP
jgi:hypothetical protein